MADALTIENTKEQQLEIELTMQGVDATKETTVCFCIETDGMTLSFNGEKGESDTWKFNIPILPQLKRTSYDYKVVVVADGYYFEPATGVVTIVGPHDIYTSAPKNVTLEPKKVEKKVEKKKVEKTVEKKKVEPKMIAVDDKADKKEEKVVKKEEKKLDEKKPKKIEFSKIKRDKKKTTKKKPSFKQSVKETAIEIIAEATTKKTVEPTTKDVAVKQAIAEVEKSEKEKFIKKTIAEARGSIIKVETKGDRKVIQFSDATPTNGKPRFRDVALVEEVQEVPIKTEKDEEIDKILREVQATAIEPGKAPTVQFKKGKVVQ